MMRPLPDTRMTTTRKGGGGGALAAGDAGRREHGEPSCQQVAYQGRERVAGAGGVAGPLQRGALIQVGAQRLIPLLVRLAPAGQQLPARPWDGTAVIVLICRRKAAAGGTRLTRGSRPVTPFPCLLAAV